MGTLFPYEHGDLSEVFYGLRTDTIMSMPSGKQAPSGPFARAVSKEVYSLMAKHRVSGAQLCTGMDMSQSYLSKRLRDDAPFTLNDLAMICAELGEDVFELIAAARRNI